MSDIHDFLNPLYEEILTSKEKRIIHQMFSCHSELFRSDYRINNYEERKVWNNIVSSMPKSDRRMVYRYLNEYDKMDVHEGDVLTIEHSLTTTKIGRKFTSSYNYVGKYIIRCKSLKGTQGHDMSVLWNDSYSILKGEQQVNFEEHTSFLVDKVIDVHGKPYVYLHEI